MPVLSLKNIYKTYINNGISLNVLNDISLDINKGEFVSILGPSGCGKSTTLKICSSIIYQDSGSVNVFGIEVHKPNKNRILMLQDDNQLFPWLTVKKNISFSLDKSKAGRVESNLDNLLDMSGLSEFLEYYPHQLSGGMKKRTALARAIAGDPDILLMDEPFGSLDAKKKITLQNFLLDIWKKYKITILFVTHDIHEAIYLGQRIVIMNNSGSIICDDKLNKSENEVLSEDEKFEMYRKYYALIDAN